MKNQVLFAIKQLQNAIVRHICEDMKQHHIMSPPTLIQAQIIEYLIHNKDVYQRDLESVLKLRRSTISGILQTMEKNQMIERVDSKSDARVKKITLTKEALKKHYEVLYYHEQLEQQMIQNVSQEEFDIFYKVIEKMTKNIEIK